MLLFFPADYAQKKSIRYSLSILPIKLSMISLKSTELSAVTDINLEGFKMLFILELPKLPSKRQTETILYIFYRLTIIIISIILGERVC